MLAGGEPANGGIPAGGLKPGGKPFGGIGKPGGRGGMPHPPGAIGGGKPGGRGGIPGTGVSVIFPPLLYS